MYTIVHTCETILWEVIVITEIRERLIQLIHVKINVVQWSSGPSKSTVRWSTAWRLGAAVDEPCPELSPWSIRVMSKHVEAVDMSKRVKQDVAIKASLYRNESYMFGRLFSERCWIDRTKGKLSWLQQRLCWSCVSLLCVPFWFRKNNFRRIVLSSVMEWWLEHIGAD